MLETRKTNISNTNQQSSNFYVSVIVILFMLRLRIIELLSNFFRSVICLSPEELTKCIYLSLNTLAPAYEGVELGIGKFTLKLDPRERIHQKLLILALFAGATADPDGNRIVIVTVLAAAQFSSRGLSYDVMSCSCSAHHCYL